MKLKTERLNAVRRKLKANTRPSASGCWLWSGYTQPNGYGWLNVAGLKIAAHRAALIVAGRDVPNGLDVCHRCDVRNCVNPAHLYVGTRAENMADCSERHRHNKPIGESHWRAKLSSADVKSIRARRDSGEFLRTIAVDFGVHTTTILRIARREYRMEVA